jgi:hypothetical protein
MTAGADRNGSLFEAADGGRWVATDLARGPWDPQACHGGPVAALLARELERADGATDETWQLARTTIELTRPVAIGRPLRARTTVERPGRRVSVVASTLLDGETVVAMARGLRIELHDLTLPPETSEPVDDAPERPDHGVEIPTTWKPIADVAYHSDACELRLVEGSWTEPGPVGVWIRLRAEVVPDERPSGVQRVAAAADFGNGVSAGIGSDRFTFINPDLTIHLGRPPVGAWIALRAESHYGSRTGTAGAAFAESALYDERGRVGRSVQSLIIRPR